jgi:hypothetical protein
MLNQHTSVDIYDPTVPVNVNGETLNTINFYSTWQSTKRPTPRQHSSAYASLTINPKPHFELTQAAVVLLKA